MFAVDRFHQVPQQALNLDGAWVKVIRTVPYESQLIAVDGLPAPFRPCGPAWICRADMIKVCVFDSGQ
jgi:hypothetical protein